MAKFFDDNSLSIGNTPLIKINRMAQGLKATVLGKIEGRNPSYSVKCRIGASMIWTAEKEGRLKPGMEIKTPVRLAAFDGLTEISGVLMISFTWTLLGLRSFATTLQLMSSSVTIPIGRFRCMTIQLPTSSWHMTFAAFATVASMLIMVGLRFITSLSDTRVSNRIVLDVFFMSHLPSAFWSDDYNLPILTNSDIKYWARACSDAAVGSWRFYNGQKDGCFAQKKPN
jgi:hypothetical protein